MKVTKAKIEANRRNAQLSTGPKTPEGKAAVRYNALKHGILAKEVVIAKGDGREEGGRFEELLSGLRDELNPLGVLEEMLVEKIAVSFWRLGRVLRAETGVLRKDLDSALLRDASRRVDRFNRDKSSLVYFDAAKDNLRRSSLGLDFLIVALDDARSDVERENCLTDETWERLKGSFAVAPIPVEGPDGGAVWDDFMLRLAAASDAGEEGKEAALLVLNEEMMRFHTLRDALAEAERLETEAQVAALSVPDERTTQRLALYERRIERELYRAMRQLERVQRQRQGEAVPLDRPWVIGHSGEGIRPHAASAT